MYKRENIAPFKNKSFKKLIYKFILWLFPFFVLLFIEILLRIFGYGDNFKLFINHPDKQFKEYKICNPLIGEKYFSKLEPTTPPNDMFLKEKPANGFRIFVIGSSTVAGFPYGENLKFSRILEERLQDIYPEKHIELVNTALSAINSYTFLDFINDILKEKPDAILFYEGHNEFYGAFGIGSNERMSKYRQLTLLHLDLMNLRIYQLMRNLIIAISKLTNTNSFSDDTGTLMKRIAGSKEIGYKSDIYNKGIRQFKDNMTALFEKAKKKNIPVFISEVVSNIRDMKPFFSMQTAQFLPATDVYNKAKELEQQGKFEEAKRNYYLAKDLDCVRFRASEEINEAIHQLARQYNAYLVPMKMYFEKNSPHGLMGNNLFTEHLHPNIDGQFIMADAFFNEIVKSRLISNQFNLLYYETSDYYKRNWGYTELDSLFALHWINILKCTWPFQPLNTPYIDYWHLYKPKSFVDSLAFFGLKENEIVKLHLQLAKYYKKRNDFYNAYKEYYSMVKCFPYSVDYYISTASCLIKIDDFQTALKLLNKSLDLKETFWGYYMKGEILLLKNEYSLALKAFDNAYRLSENQVNKEKVLSKQLEVFYYSGQNEKSKEIFRELRQIDPVYRLNLPKKRADYTSIVPLQVKSLIDLALENYRKGNFDVALKEFLASLEIKETALANFNVGEILVKKNDKNAIIFLLKAYPEYKNDMNLLYNICLAYLQAGRTKQAYGVLETMKRINPSHTNVSRLEKLMSS
jgi:tetratricopeptide (TPR) repeat protein